MGLAVQRCKERGRGLGAVVVAVVATHMWRLLSWRLLPLVLPQPAGSVDQTVSLLKGSKT